MSYFQNFPRVTYDFPDGVTRNINNLSLRAGIVEEFFELTTNFETYTIKDGDTPEIIAYEKYGDVNMHWIVMLSNNVFNIYKDWPKTSNQFEKWIYEKYRYAKGAESDSEYQLSDDEVQQVIEFSGTPSVAFQGKIERNGGVDYILLRPHHFIDDEGTEYSYETVMTAANVNAYGYSYTMPEVTPVSIFQHLSEKNEEKRDIILPLPEVAQQMRKELKKIINEQ